MGIVAIVAAGGGDTDEADVNEMKGGIMMLNLVWKNRTETYNNNVITS